MSVKTQPLTSIYQLDNLPGSVFVGAAIIVDEGLVGIALAAHLLVPWVMLVLMVDGRLVNPLKASFFIRKWHPSRDLQLVDRDTASSFRLQN